MIRTSKRIIYIWIARFFLVLGVVFTIVFINTLEYTCDELKDDFLDNEIKSVLTEKYIDKMNKGAMVWKFRNGEDWIYLYFGKSTWKSAELGDSIVKKAGSLECWITRGDSTFSVVIGCE